MILWEKGLYTAIDWAQNLHFDNEQDIHTSARNYDESVWRSAREVFGHIESVKIHVILNPTGYMLTSPGFDAFIHLSYIL